MEEETIDQFVARGGVIHQIKPKDKAPTSYSQEYKFFTIRKLKDIKAELERRLRRVVKHQDIKFDAQINRIKKHLKDIDTILEERM